MTSSDPMGPGGDVSPQQEGAGENLCATCSGSGQVDGQQCTTCGGSGVQVEPVSGA